MGNGPNFIIMYLSLLLILVNADQMLMIHCDILTSTTDVTIYSAFNIPDTYVWIKYKINYV